MRSIFITIGIFLFLGIGKSFAQEELGLHFMPQVGQSSFTNPAFFSSHKIGINLAAPFVNLYNSGFSIRDVLHKIPGTDSLRLDFDTAIENMDDENNMFYQFHVDVLYLTIQFKKLQLGLSYGLKANAYANYPKSLIDIAWNGNAAYIGQSVQIAPDFQSYGYHEFSLGAAYKVNKSLSVGARFKYLSGIADFSSDRDRQSAILTTDTDIYQVSLETDYVIHSSGFPELDSNFNVVGDSGFELFPHSGTFGSNTGFAFDLGFQYEINEKLSVSASILDVGGIINWDKNLKTYESQGQFNYEGIDITPLITGDTLNFEALGDTISNAFEVQTATDTKAYSTTIPSRMYLSGSYNWSDNLRFGGLFYTEFYRGKTRPALSIFAQHDFFNDLLSIGVNYSYRNNELFNLGLNGVVKLGPVQLFMATDNIVPVFKPYDSRNFNFRAGLNILLIKNTETGTKQPIEN